MPVDAVENHLGPAARLFHGARSDEELAGLLVEHFARLERPRGVPVAFLGAAEARQHALSAGLTQAEVDTLCVETPFIQILNNLIEYFLPSDERARTPTREFALRCLDVGPGDRLLDAGCSTGRYLLEFADTGAELFGLDKSLFAMEVGRRAWLRVRGAPTPTWHAQSILEIPLPDGFCTHVTSYVVLGYVPVRRSLAEIRRVLDENGKLLITLEGPGFMTELADQRRSSGQPSAVDLARFYVASKLMQWGFDWQETSGLQRLSGVTMFSAETMSRIVGEAGFEVETVETLGSFRGRDRLIGLVARRR